MVYVITKETASEPSDENKLEADLVEFNFTKERVQSNTYVGATINAHGLDRLVIWPLEGGPTVFEGQVNISMGIESIEFQSDNVTQYK